MPKGVDKTSPRSSGIELKHRESTIFLICCGCNVDLPQSANRFPFPETSSIDPQHFAESCGVTTICFSPISLFWLDQDDFLAAVVAKHADQPIIKIKTADFKDGHKRLAVSQPLTSETLKELVDLVGTRRNLSCHQDIAAVIAK
ncbi:MAG: hypothetical protein KDB27_15075 [Planctomycetales bacterium]|nr:hypothetical protein [Planctomycetales bacterium]